MTMWEGHCWRNFSKRIHDNTKMSCEFQEGLLVIFIHVGSEGHYETIREVRVGIRIDSPKKATWLEIYLPEKLRGKGIGSSIVRIMLSYLKENGITEVSGKISPVDAHNDGSFKKVSGFWKKNGFAVIPYRPDDRTRWVARIVCALRCHGNYH